MNFLVDAALSPLIAEGLVRAGHDAMHVRDLGLATANDQTILNAAAHQQRILVSADTDFGAILALRREGQPSVILFRRGQRRPQEQLASLLANLPSIETALEEGCVAVLEDQRVRIRRLPIIAREDG